MIQGPDTMVSIGGGEFHRFQHRHILNFWARSPRPRLLGASFQSGFQFRARLKSDNASYADSNYFASPWISPWTGVPWFAPGTPRALKYSLPQRPPISDMTARKASTIFNTSRLFRPSLSTDIAPKLTLLSMIDSI